MIYRDVIELPVETYPEDVESVISDVQALVTDTDVALVDDPDRPGADAATRISFSIETDGDLWDLYAAVEELAVELRSRGVDYDPDRTKIVATATASLCGIEATASVAEWEDDARFAWVALRIAPCPTAADPDAVYSILVKKPVE